jgi:hypothetical protein
MITQSPLVPGQKKSKPNKNQMKQSVVFADDKEIQDDDDFEEDNVPLDNKARQRKQFMKERERSFRTDKSLNSKIPYFSIVWKTLIISLFFVLLLLTNLSYIDGLYDIFPMYESLNRRISNTQFVVDFARDTVMNKAFKFYDEKNLFENYITKLNSDEDILFKLFHKSLPSQFNNFQNFFYNSSFLNMCQSKYKNITLGNSSFKYMLFFLKTSKKSCTLTYNYFR